ncbi:cupredoxin domain-containing protein [Tahibacter amnicola]|uniref:Plastocyanin/azurin family copper-binding protein n=1 Tax=Tahibacter amnicola TaxID=2976241 RepID=A0ABY6BD36_9GAMM|nr:plastocyanin/azurin family copper-binding protein [Tahibacter amnicola]UXI66521.1 plastocyanin/azurin family copper-binding protein [Tahibacter amnicola]
MNPLIRRILAGIALLTASACATAANHAVRVGPGLTFSPANLTVQAGDTVTFTNAGGFHNVVADDNSFRCAAGCDGAGGSGAPSSNAWSATVTFNTAGTKGYFCEVHGSPGVGMAGRIVVEGGGNTFTIPPGISGNWYDPNQNGHGFQFEMVTPTVMTAFWFTFDNNGAPAWISAAGTIEGNRVVMQANRLGGGRFPPNFNPANVTTLPWGTLTFTFTSCTSGRVDWTSTDPAFTPSGNMTLTRLTQINGLACP